MKHVSAKDKQKEATEKLAQGNIGEALVDYVKFLLHGGSHVFMLEGRTINKDLGLSTTSLDQIIKEAVKRTNPAQ